MKLGACSISLNVSNLANSRAFYTKLGFDVFAGDPGKNYLIMKNGDSLIGLFQGMFQGNLITFNPGWDQSANPVHPYDDVREIQRTLKERGVQFLSETAPEGTGPASIMVSDPDGNVILIDQHVG